MKRNLRTSFVCAILAAISVTSFAQKVSFGEYTGINFSNLHGYLTSNKWASKPGPSAGFFVEYNLGRLFSVQTEIGYLSQYYEMKSYKQQYSYPPVDVDDGYYRYSNIWSPVYEPYKWDFSFLRFPLLFKYKTPTRLQLGIGGGMFYSVLMKDDLTKAERNVAKEEDRNIYPPTHDWGYLFLADLSYPVTKVLRVSLAGRLTSGQKVFIESYKAKNGSSELLFGLKYTPQPRAYKVPIDLEPSKPDSSFTRCYVKPVVGVTMAWNSAKQKLGNYSENFGSNAGLIFGYRLDKTVSLQSGFQFQQKGYSFSDSSFMNHRYVADIVTPGRKVDTKVNFNYLTIPLNLNLSFGKSVAFYLDFGIYAEFMVNANCTGTVINEYKGGNYYRLEKQNLNDGVEGYYKSTDFGYSTGFGFQFPFKNNMKFDIGIHYAGGFKNILEKPNEYDFNGYKNDLSFENSSLSLQFGLQIPIPN
jgi:hypothetical protein